MTCAIILHFIFAEEAQNFPIKQTGQTMDLSLIFELAKSVTTRFDVILHRSEDYKGLDIKPLAGCVWADLTSLKPLFNSGANEIGRCAGISIYEHSIQQALHILFNRFQKQNYTQGMFLLKAEYGEDWFTPILQHPHVVLRQPSKWKERSGKQSSGKGAHEAFVLFYLGNRVNEFCSAFYPIGLIPGVNSW
jgi:hypothetical protein